MLKQILSGVVIGVANIIPGVSGGTMMVAMGIYDKLISAITGLFKNFKKSVKFLLPIAIGMALGIVVLSKVIGIMFDVIPFQTNCLFIGLIVGSFPFIVKNVKGHSVKIQHIIACLLFFGLVLGSALMGEGSGADATLVGGIVPMIKLFAVGLIASATMIIPGVSGSMVLMILGYYDSIISNISLFIENVLTWNVDGIIEGLMIFIPFGLGVVAGVFIVAKLVEIIFQKFPLVAYWAIIGLIVASPFAIFISAGFEGVNVISVITGVVALAVGAFVGNKLGGDNVEETVTEEAKAA
jgi:putative membrane protein